MDQIKKMNYSDWLGAAASGICAIHCTLLPLFFVVQPVLGNAAAEHPGGLLILGLLDYVFLILSLLAVWYSARHTTHTTLKWILWFGWGMFAFGLLSEPFELPIGKWLMYAGSTTLVVAHLKNYRYCQKCTLKAQD